MSKESYSTEKQRENGDEQQINTKRVQPENLLTITTFNVASLRAAWRQGFREYVDTAKPDIICLQETKMSNNASPSIDQMRIKGYHAFFLHAKKAGYSGTAVYTKIEPKSVKKSDGISDENGRCMTIEFDKFFLVNTYVVNAGADNCKNLETKMKVFLPELKKHLNDLRKTKPVIWTGDLNVAHQEIDIWWAQGHEMCAGFTKQERQWFDSFLKEGWCDVFRTLYPKKQQFTFFNFRGNEKAKNHGWRIDYFIVTQDLMEMDGLICDCSINSRIDFSDHCPLTLFLDRDKIITSEDKTVVETKVEDICAKKGASILDFMRPKRRVM